jgi:predicted nucleotidyltransferase
MQKIPLNLRKEIICRLVDEFHPEVIYLFGSHAWGEPTSDSDMDFLVIVKNSRQKPIRRAVRAQRSLRGIKAAVDVLVKTHKEFEQYISVKASLEVQIIREGKLLYGRKAFSGS